MYAVFAKGFRLSEHADHVQNVAMQRVISSPDPIVCFEDVFKQRTVFATSFPRTRLWSL